MRHCCWRRGKRSGLIRCPCEGRTQGWSYMRCRSNRKEQPIPAGDVSYIFACCSSQCVCMQRRSVAVAGPVAGGWTGRSPPWLTSRVTALSGSIHE